MTERKFISPMLKTARQQALAYIDRMIGQGFTFNRVTATRDENQQAVVTVYMNARF